MSFSSSPGPVENLWTAAHLAPEGRLVVGFGLDRGYAIEDFLADATEAGLRLVQRYGTWDLRPASEGPLVGVLVRGRARRAG